MNRIEILRKELGLTQEQLADKLGLSQRAIGFYEKGEREPRNETLSKMSELFNASIDYILGNSDVRNPSKYDEELVKFGLKLKKEYEPPTAEQKKQIEDFIEFVLKDNKKE